MKLIDLLVFRLDRSVKAMMIKYVDISSEMINSLWFYGDVLL